jgi:predicted Zn-dependent protease
VRARQAGGLRHGTLLLAAFLCLPAFGADDALTRAMRDELVRSMKKLQLENLEKPYFVAYRIVETSGCTAMASFGAVTTASCQTPENAARTRTLNVEVRVGDYARDNTNFYAPMTTSGVIRIVTSSNGGGVQVPIEDNYDELRRQLWLATDSAYKTALDTYAKKKAALEHRTRQEDTPDFSKEPVITDTENDPPIVWNPRDVQALVKSLSAVFREAPGIDNSDVRFNANRWTTWYVNSEGTSYTRAKSLATLQVNADTQASDGMPLVDFDVAYARSVADLPSREEMTKRIRALTTRLAAAKKAPLVERYSGPVLFEGQASAELFFQSLAGALTGAPRTVTDGGVMGNAFAMAFNSNGGLADRVGARILPDFVSLKDAPALRDYNGQPLFGGYQVDDDGVKAGETSVVDRGILQTLLHSRSLIANTTHSTANRRAAGVMASNLVFTAEKPMSSEQLKNELIRMVKQRNKEYGILVRRMNNQMLSVSLGRARVVTFSTSGAPASLQVEPALEACKVFPDGHEELVRNLNINGLTLDTYKSVTAVSEPSTVYTAPMRVIARAAMTGLTTLAPGGPNVVSANVPSMLFEDLTLQKPSGDVPVLPFSTHPYFDK